jgi:hypothetical protein
MRTPPIPDSQIFAVIADGAHLTGEIARTLGRSRSSLYKRLHRMVTARKLRLVDQSVHHRGGYYLPDQPWIRRSEGPIVVLDAIAGGCNTWSAIRARTGGTGITHHVNALIREGLIRKVDQKLYPCNGRPVTVKPKKATRAGPPPVYERSGARYHDGHEAAVQAAGEAQRARLTRLLGH